MECVSYNYKPSMLARGIVFVRELERRGCIYFCAGGFCANSTPFWI
jgi:hypothetical protein